MFLVMTVKKKLGVEVMGLEKEIDLCFADGMIGAVPVFKDRESAEAWANDKSDVMEVKYKND